jgi:hypothetical protein
MAHLVRYAARDPSREPQSQIQSIGGERRDGTQWRISVAEAISQIESFNETYYVNIGGFTPNLVVACVRGKKFLKTTNEKDLPLILLSLPDFPVIASDKPQSHAQP